MKTLNFATKTKIKWKSLEKKTGNFDTLFHKAYRDHAQVSVKRTKSSEQWERHKWLCLKAPAGCPGDTDGCNLSVICVVNYSCIDCTSGVDNPEVVSPREDRHEQKEVSLNKHSYYWMLQTETKLITGRSATLGCAEDGQTEISRKCDNVIWDYLVYYVIEYFFKLIVRLKNSIVVLLCPV